MGTIEIVVRFNGRIANPENRAYGYSIDYSTLQTPNISTYIDRP